MPRSKRSPIDYTPQFGSGIFRPRDVVESELAAEEERAAGAAGAAVSALPAERTATRPTRSPKINERSNEEMNVRTSERTKIRHTFDIFRDQLQALTEIQTARFRRDSRKPKMGELVMEALDAYIAAANERTNERTKHRSNAG
jgi:hypothetical protein